MCGGASVAGALTAGYLLGHPLASTPIEAVVLTAAAVPIGLVYALIPDLDLRGTLSRGLGWIGWLLTFVIRPLSRATHGRAHRGLTHAWWFVAVVAAPWALLHPLLALAAVVGGWSHLLLDSKPLRARTRENRAPYQAWED